MSIAPGFTETDSAMAMIDRMAKKSGHGYDAARQELTEMVGGIPVGRPNAPADAAAPGSRARRHDPRRVVHEVPPRVEYDAHRGDDLLRGLARRVFVVKLS